MGESTLRNVMACILEIYEETKYHWLLLYQGETPKQTINFSFKAFINSMESSLIWKNMENFVPSLGLTHIELL